MSYPPVRVETWTTIESAKAAEPGSRNGAPTQTSIAPESVPSPTRINGDRSGYPTRSEGRPQGCATARAKSAQPSSSAIFISRRKRLFCGPACLRTKTLRGNTRKYKATYAYLPPLASECDYCAEAFVRAERRGSSPTKANYCSKTCGNRAGKDSRRARLKGVERERVYRAKVYARDRWTCQLCGERIDRTASVPHPRAATIDHILPISKGGSHTYANVQAAHFICNSIKGDRGTDQLRLVG